MTVNRTTLLDLPLPVTGTESGTWGDTTNNGLTQYMDIAIAGMSNLTSANFTTGALTIETTEGNSSATNISATSAQYAGFRVTSLAQNSTITVGNTGTNPARSYRLINADATYTLTFKATGQTGITLQPGQTAVVAFNGTDYVIVGMAGAGTVTDNAVVRFDGTTGKLVQNSVVTIADSTGDVAGVGALTASGNLTLSGGTANGVLYLNGSKVATSGAALTWDGSTFYVKPTGAQFVTGATFAKIENVAGASASLIMADTTDSGTIKNIGSSIAFINSASEGMRLSSTGLGIGTSSPGGLLQVGVPNTSTGSLRAYSGSVSIDAGYQSSGVSGTAAAPSLIWLGDDNTGIWHPASDTLAISTDGAERARIDSSGNLLVGGTNPSALGIGAQRVNCIGSSGVSGLLVTEESGSNASAALILVASTSGYTANIVDIRTGMASGAGYNAISYKSDTNVTRFNVSGNGDVTNTNNSYGAISDAKLKENIVDATPKLADLMQVKVRKYNLIGETQKHIGVVAQELEAVFPAMIDKAPDKDAEGNDLGTTTKSVKYSVFVPMLIKAMQEQQALIESLTSRVAQLEGV